MEDSFKAELISPHIVVAQSELQPVIRQPHTLKDLSGETFLEYYRRGAPALFREVISTCRKAGFSPKAILEFEEMSSVILAVESGLGVSLTLGFVRGMLTRDSVVRQINPASSKIPLCAVWPAGPQELVVKSFVEVLRARKSTIKKEMEWAG